MTHSVFIDFPDDLYSYKYCPGDKIGSDVVSRLLGIKVEFVCNRHAKISKGDVYEVSFDEPEDVTVFLLKCEYRLVSKDKIKEYRVGKRRKGAMRPFC